MEKLTCHLGSTQDVWRDTEHSSRYWFYVNQRAHEMLSTVKETIGNDGRWERCKKYFNTYELISTSTPEARSVAEYSPVSRSYFKMIELLHDHHDDLMTPHASKAAFLCDAPGGFIEAFLMYRRRRSSGVDHGGWIGKDVLHAISLLDERMPAWRVPRDLLRNNNVHLHGGGETGNNGDLYEITNIDDFVTKVGEHTCGLVTADGGFDYSSDFNSQERSSLRLMVSEVYTAMRSLADGGALVLKVYDMCLPATLRLLWHLHCAFSRGVIIDKPCTSRVANSEKFLICRWFERTARVDRLLKMLRISVCQGQGDVPLVRGGRTLPPAWFLRELTVFNIRYVTSQTRCIVETMKHMHSIEPVVFPRVAEQSAAARRWCSTYGIGISAHHRSHPLGDTRPNWDQPAKFPTTGCDREGTSDTHNPVRCKSRSPSTTPYKDGLLLPGRKLEGANCVELPGGGLAEERQKLVA